MRKLIARFKVRALEIEHDRLDRALLETADPVARALLLASREITKRNLSQARADFTALHAPGVRFIWREA